MTTIINLHQGIEWTKLYWDRVWDKEILLNSILPKVGSKYLITANYRTQALGLGETHILWTPPHSELNNWGYDRPWEILDSYLIVGDIYCKGKIPSDYHFEVSEVNLFVEYISRGKMCSKNILPMQRATDRAVKSVFNDSFSTKIFEFDRFIYLSCDVPDSFYELIFTKLENRLVALYSAALPYAGYYARISKYELSEAEDAHFKEIMLNAEVLENKRSSNLKVGYIAGAAWW